MLGLIVYRGGAPSPPLRVIEGARFRVAAVQPGTSLRAKFSARAAARALAREGVRQAVFPEGYACRSVFARHGVGAVSVVPLHCATAAAIVRRCMAQRGLDPRRATVAFVSETVSPELRRAVGELCAEVRYVALAVPGGGEELARTLKREYGVAARLALPGELRADLTVAFAPCLAGEDTLRLWDPALAVEYDSELPAALLSALWAMGAVDAGELRVRTVRTERKERGQQCAGVDERHP